MTDTRNQMYIFDQRDLMTHDCVISEDESGNDLRTFDCVLFDLATQPGWQAFCRHWRMDNKPGQGKANYLPHPPLKPSRHRIHRKR